MDYVRLKIEDEKRLDAERALDLGVAIPRPQEMWERHEEVMRLIATGHSVGQVAQKTGMTAATINKIRRSPLFQERLACFKGKRDADTHDIMDEIRSLQPIALNVLKTMVEDMDSCKEEFSVTERLRTVQYINGINGIVPPKDVRVQTASRDLTKEALAKVRERCLSLGIPVEDDLE